MISPTDNCFVENTFLCCEEIQKTDLDEIDPEVFPLVLGMVLLVLAVEFTVYVVCVTRRCIKVGPASRPTPRNSGLPFAFAESMPCDLGENDETSQDTEEAPALVSWKNISCSYSGSSNNNNNNKNGHNSNCEENAVLSGSSGVVRKGELVAIMGPSGSGTSFTFLLL